MSKIIKRSLEGIAAIASFFLGSAALNQADAQNNIDIHMYNARSGVNLGGSHFQTVIKNTGTGQIRFLRTDSTSGIGTINLPTGHYIFRGEGDERYAQLNDTLDINGAMAIESPMIHDDSVWSTYYPQGMMQLVRNLTGTEQAGPNRTIGRQASGDIGVFFVGQTPAMSAIYDTAKADAREKNHRMNLFEKTAENDTGLTIRYVHNNEMPHPGLIGETYTDAHEGKKIIHATIYINIDRPQSVGTLERELLWGTGINCFGLDPSFVSAENGHGSERYQRDEAMVWEIQYGLPIGYNMDKFGAILSSLTSVKNPTELPFGFKLMQNYPNPFNGTTTIKYTLPEKSKVKLSIYNILGEEVAKITDNKYVNAGEQTTIWSTKNLPSGEYFYKIDVTTQEGLFFSQTNKAMLVK